MNFSQTTSGKSISNSVYSNSCVSVCVFMCECICSLGAPVPPVHDSHLFSLSHVGLMTAVRVKSICINTSQNCKLVELHMSIKAKPQSENSSG